MVFILSLSKGYLRMILPCSPKLRGSKLFQPKGNLKKPDLEVLFFPHLLLRFPPILGGTKFHLSFSLTL